MKHKTYYTTTTATKADKMIAPRSCLTRRAHINHDNRSPKGPDVILSSNAGVPRATPRPRPLPESPLPLFGSLLPRPRGLVEGYGPNISKRNL